MKRLLLALFLLIASMPSAFAAISCTVATTSVAFGVYDPTSGIDKTSNGSVTVTCLIVVGLSGSVAYNVNIAPGNGSYAARALKSGALTLNYNLYTDAGLSQVWGDGTASTGRISDSYSIPLVGSIVSYNVYGKIPARQNPGMGSFTDSMIVTVNY